MLAMGSVRGSYPKNVAIDIAFCLIRVLVKLHNDNVIAEGQRACLVLKTAKESTGFSVHAIPSSPPIESLCGS
jgi:hypothetical protein